MLCEFTTYLLNYLFITVNTNKVVINIWSEMESSWPWPWPRCDKWSSRNGLRRKALLALCALFFMLINVKN